MKVQEAAQYDMRLNPCYQIDWRETFAGKRLTTTKRRISFRFGFSNAEAISNGEVGPNCRGIEHEAVLTWSLNSRKRVVVYDGQEVHFSVGNRMENRFETSWSIQGNHVLKIVAHAAVPVFPPPGFRQYDLYIDGLSIFEMPHIYELGRRSFAGNDDGSNDKYGVLTREVESSAASAYAAPPSQDFSSMNKDLVSDASVPSLGQISQLSSDFSDTSSNYDMFAPVAPAPEKPSLTKVHTDILNAYEQFVPSAPTATLKNESHSLDVSSNMPLPNQDTSSTKGLLIQSNSNNYHNTNNSVPTVPYGAVMPISGSVSHAAEAPTTAKPSSLSNLYAIEEEHSQNNTSDVDRALRILVNLDDINEAAVSPEQQKLTMFQEGEKKNINNKHSMPLPPVQGAWNLGSHASLNEIQSSATKPKVTREVMKSYPFDASAAQTGMMVPYGATEQRSYYNYGPPTSQTATAGVGFGVAPYKYAY